MSNNKSVIVKVIDRGPYGRGRIIDLSWAAAKEIDMIAQGVARVKVEMLENPIPFKPEDPKLPKVDFEFAETNVKFVGDWKVPKINIGKKESKSEKNQEGKNQEIKKLEEKKKIEEKKKEADKKKEEKNVHSASNKNK